jgi:hypothetical protein
MAGFGLPGKVMRIGATEKVVVNDFCGCDEEGNRLRQLMD